MTHKLTVYRRKVEKDDGRGTEWLVNYTPIMEALAASGLDNFFVRRYSKYYSYCNSPEGCIKGDTKEIFIFKYKFSEVKEFFMKIAALKDVANIARYYLIQG